jgi:hypothetical protein
MLKEKKLKVTPLWFERPKVSMHLTYLKTPQRGGNAISIFGIHVIFLA